MTSRSYIITIIIELCFENSKSTLGFCNQKSMFIKRVYDHEILSLVPDGLDVGFC